MSNVALLEHLLLHREVPTWHAQGSPNAESTHAIARLVAATQANIQEIDWAVLFRQCLRRLHSSEVVRVSRLGPPLERLLARVDVYQNLDGTMQAMPYRPHWVFGLGGMDLDCPPERNQSFRGSLEAEPWLRRLVGRTSWKSPAQKEATWLALNAPGNSTLLVGLPTGSGKSMVYQCCAVFSPGLTVLVVPTIALGIDQLAALSDFASKTQLQPAFYTTDALANSVLDAVETRRCRLLITSPEAIVNGRLRSILERHSIEGHLQQVVIDEAHLVESWGADFRVGFQLLGATLRQWRMQSPTGIRVLLLSATFSPQAPEVLERLFAHDGGVWDKHIIQRLRPEIHYFTAANWASVDDQATRVAEALLRLPRPAILYVSTKRRAEEFGAILGEQGFQRMRVFHGDTSRVERQKILEDWRQDRIDLIVATSAFGMGVDKPDVKAVVHACMPEGIDRFYQEVGRGGRDGSSTISLLIPGGQDNRVADSLGPTLLADPRKIQGRWDAMWRSREGSNENCFLIPTAQAPIHLIASETYGESVLWNKRLLLLMERSALLEIVGLLSRSTDNGATYREYANIRLKRNAFDLEHDLPSLVHERRNEEINAVATSLSRLKKYFNHDQPICRELQHHFGKHTQRSCGSCSFCRMNQVQPKPDRELIFTNTTDMTHPIVHLIEVQMANTQIAASNLASVIRRILKSGLIRRFLVPSKNRQWVCELFARAENSSTGPYRIDNLEEADVLRINAHETFVVFHFQAIDLSTAALNHCGSLVAHWQLGGTVENSPGRWPFMHEFSARPYAGPQALDDWFYDLERAVIPTQ